jgi:hypothetical protein
MTAPPKIHGLTRVSIWRAGESLEDHGDYDDYFIGPDENSNAIYCVATSWPRDREENREAVILQARRRGGGNATSGERKSGKGSLVLSRRRFFG